MSYNQYFDLGTLDSSQPKYFSDYVLGYFYINNNIMDVYYFSLDAPGRLNISLDYGSDLTSSVGASLREDLGTKKDYDTFEDPVIRTFLAPNSLDFDLQSGDYILDVSTFSTDFIFQDYEGVLTLNDSTSRDDNDDRFEENDSKDTAHNFGLVSNLVEENLVMLDSSLDYSDGDWYKFTTSNTGDVEVVIEFDNNLGDLDLYVIDSSGADHLSRETNNIEQISLRDTEPGEFFIQVYGYDSATNPNYSLNINTSNIILNDSLFRFRHKNISGTYLFAGEAESAGIRENFSEVFAEEGEAFKVSLQAGDDLVRFNRFSNNQVQGTYLYATEAESASIRENFSNVFKEEGIAFYSYGADANLGQDVIRFRNKNIAGTYLFVLGAEAETIRQNFSDVFEEEGVAFEVVVA